MASRSARNGRYDDPYLFDDPYNSTSPPQNAYEYVGTDDPSGFPEHRQQRPHSPLDEPRRRSSASVKHARTTSQPSPPRRSRRGRDQTPPPAYPRSPSPPRHRSSRRTSPPPPPSARASREAPPRPKAQALHTKYQEFAHRPDVQRAQTIGKKGLSLLGSAAAAYYASHPPDDPRARSTGRDLPDDREYDRDRGRRHRHHRREDSYYDSDELPQRSRRDRRRHSPSPSPSPSPPRRRRSDRHSRRREPSVASSVSSRDRDRSRRGRNHERPGRRAYSYSPSPPPPRTDRSRRRKSAGPVSSRSAPKTSSEDKSSAANERWQLAIRAALQAGGMAALKMRNQPGSWKGDKGARVAKAALGAAAMDAFIDSDPRLDRRTGVKGMAESAITGLLATKLAGASRKSKSKSRS